MHALAGRRACTAGTTRRGRSASCAPAAAAAGVRGVAAAACAAAHHQKQQHHQHVVVPAAAQSAAAQPAPATCQHRRPRGLRVVVVAASASTASNNGAGAPSSNGNGASPAGCPTPAETARTVADLSTEGVLSTLTPAGTPLGTPVGYSLDAEGVPLLVVAAGSPEAANMASQPRVSLLVQPISYPARGVASVALQGTASLADDQAGAPAGTQLFSLAVESAVYYGGLDQAAHGQVIDGATYRAAEPDLLRREAAGLIATWNSERAEDVYRIVASHLGLPLEEMIDAELLWIDRLGIYVACEVLGRAPTVVRVPFYRPVLDERDARSVLTMGSHIGWEEERQRAGGAYVPPPIAPSPVAAASNN